MSLSGYNEILTRINAEQELIALLLQTIRDEKYDMQITDEDKKKTQDMLVSAKIRLSEAKGDLDAYWDWKETGDDYEPETFVPTIVLSQCLSRRGNGVTWTRHSNAKMWSRFVVEENGNILTSPEFEKDFEIRTTCSGYEVIRIN